MRKYKKDGEYHLVMTPFEYELMERLEDKVTENGNEIDSLSDVEFEYYIYTHDICCVSGRPDTSGDIKKKRIVKRDVNVRVTRYPIDIVPIL